MQETSDKLYLEYGLSVIKNPQYEHIHKGTGKTEFYRFYKPKSSEYPMVIELFSKSPK